MGSLFHNFLFTDEIFDGLSYKFFVSCAVGFLNTTLVLEELSETGVLLILASEFSRFGEISVEIEYINGTAEGDCTYIHILLYFHTLFSQMIISLFFMHVYTHTVGIDVLVC